VIAIDQSAATPPFEQLRAGLLAQVSNGQLPRGSRLPTVRALATELGLAPNTVARAYRELEALGIIETRGRNGSFVSEHEDAVTRDAQRAARDYADRIRQLGVSRDDAIEFVKFALNH
jgi:DNA-binding transcriptional regulator YhcF (GntR family)